MNFARLALLVAGIVAFEEMVNAEPVESNQLRGLKTIGVDEISYGTPGMTGLEWSTVLQCSISALPT